MSHIQAPYDYVRQHYEHTVDVDARFPEVAQFVWSGLRHVVGDSVLNVGCGTTFFDYLPHFGQTPQHYVGVDINRSSLDYLENSQHPRLLDAKRLANERGVDIELICADALQHVPAIQSSFDSILGVGFFGTFSGADLHALMQVMQRALRPNGTLVKVTWHGPHRTPAQTLEKLKYGFDNEEEISPEDLVAVIERAGFKLQSNALFDCNPDTYRWDAVQTSVFTKA